MGLGQGRETIALACLQDADDGDGQDRRIDVVSDPSLGNAGPDISIAVAWISRSPSDEVLMTRMIGVERLGRYNRQRGERGSLVHRPLRAVAPLAEAPEADRDPATLLHSSPGRRLSISATTSLKGLLLF